MDLVLSPFTWLLLGFIGVLFATRRNVRRAMVLVPSIVLGVAGMFGATPLCANLLVGSLERDAAPGAECAAAADAAIVVLAGGSDRRAADADDIGALGVASLRRTLAAIALWHAHANANANAMLVLAGGPSFKGVPSDSTLMRTLAERMQVPERAIGIETGSSDTWGNARGVAALLNAPRRIALVTSAMHMPRASYAFERFGFEVCPYPADSRFVPFGLPGYLLPQTGAAQKTAQALHEWVGLAYYHVRAMREGR